MSDAPPPPPGWGQQPQQSPPPPPPPPGGPPPGPADWTQPQPAQGGAAPPPAFGAPGVPSPSGPVGYGAPPPPSSGGNRTPIIIAVIAVAVAGVIGALVVLNSGDGSDVETFNSEVADQISELASNIPATPAAPAAPPPGEVPPTLPPDQAIDVPQGEEASVFELQVGTCIGNPGEGEQIQSVQSVPCDAPHDNEVFALLQYPGGDADPFPGAEAINSFADDGCQGQAFTDYVGIEWVNSRFFTTQLTPTEGSWAQGDREIVCLLYDPTAPSTGSARGSAQ